MSKDGIVDDCIFCQMGRDDLAARVVYQDEQVVAFNDISPQAPVHVLIEHVHVHILGGRPMTHGMLRFSE